MIFELHCGDVVDGCPAHFAAADRERLLAEVSIHAASAHGLNQLSPQLVRLVERKIRAVPPPADEPRPGSR